MTRWAGEIRGGQRQGSWHGDGGRGGGALAGVHESAGVERQVPENSQSRKDSRDNIGSWAQKLVMEAPENSEKQRAKCLLAWWVVKVGGF